MAMATPTQLTEYEAMANGIAEGIWNQNLLFEEPFSFLISRGVYTADIQQDCERLGSQLHNVWNQQERVLAVLLDGPVLIDLYAFAAAPFWTGKRRDVIAKSGLGFNTIQDTIDNKMRLKTEWIDHKTARVTFASALSGFLKSRATKPVEAEDYVRFRVYSPRANCRVHYSGASFFNPNRVFGAPTSPVIGQIRPGTYVFGVKGAKDEVPIFDSAQFQVPPREEARLQV